MTWGLLNAAMLLGLIGAAAPVVIHLLDRRRDQVIDWGAMQFLEFGREARRRLRLTELLLMLTRIALLAVVAVAMARPYWGVKTSESSAAGAGSARDVVLIIDGSASMDRKTGVDTPRRLALAWARSFLSRLGLDNSVSIVVADDRVHASSGPLSFDRGKVLDTLSRLERTPARGASNLPAAVVEAFRVLERAGNPAREIVILSDGQRAAWRPGETARWALLRDLHRRLPIPPRLWAVAFGTNRNPSAEFAPPNGSVSPPTVSHGLVTPGVPLSITAEVSNAGPGPLTRIVELLVDEHSSAAAPQPVGPLPEGGRTVVTFETTLGDAGSHLLTVRLSGGEDALPGDDEASVAVEVVPAIGALLVDGEPGTEPFGGETDFLRAALAPLGEDGPRVRASVVAPETLDASALQGKRLLVLANVERLAPEQLTALERFLDDGGGLLFAPGDRTSAAFFNDLPWMPAIVGERNGDFAARKAVAHPSPSTFTGPVLTPLGQGDAPPLGRAELFAYYKLVPTEGAMILGRLDNGAPWAVERPRGKGRVLVLAGPLDAEGGTLPVNPDFVPLVHEWAFHLSRGAEPRTLEPGEALVFDLEPSPTAGVQTLMIRTPDGTERSAEVTRERGLARARFDDTAESGLYRLSLPEPPGGFSYATVRADPRESDLDPLAPLEASKLAQGWPLAFAPDPTRLPSLILQTDAPDARREFWRGLVLAALGTLCLEIYLTRRLVRGLDLSR